MHVSTLNIREGGQVYFELLDFTVMASLSFPLRFLIVSIRNKLLMYSNLHGYFKGVLIKLYGRIIFPFKLADFNRFPKFWNVIEFCLGIHFFFLKETIF